jgi:demethylmenaquinone methyltransferase/2-methoxy-6-polyprenyl-1,4-benzoquinol methylase
MPLFDHFNFLAPWYDRVFTGEGQGLREELLDLRPGLSLLDAGGGTGRISVRLVCQGCLKVVADVSPGMLVEAAGKPGLAPVRAMSERLPFAASTFDRVLMVDALHHVADQQETAQQLFAMLKPGGRLLIEEPDVRKLAVKLIAVGEKLLLMRSHFLRPDRIAALFSKLPVEVGLHYEGVNVFVVVKRTHVL